ncbi:MAG: NRDE family protein [Verrucomicrobia bacterium]|nr:NRDE family protein [Verrucomicrobiota bacterium]
MCTLTWRAVREGGYDLFFNRDELHVRGAEEPPRLEEIAGLTFAAPRDRDHQGSWLMLNARGLTVALLNFYPGGKTGRGLESRGRLPLACASCANAQEVSAVLRAHQLTNFAPFHLVAIEAGGSGLSWRWDGDALHEAPAPMFLTSSSFAPERVEAARAARFAELGEVTEEAMRAFHHYHDFDAGAESVCMRRPDACTRSVCRVRVRSGEAGELVYTPLVWPEGAPGAATTLRV